MSEETRQKAIRLVRKYWRQIEEAAGEELTKLSYKPWMKDHSPTLWADGLYLSGQPEWSHYPTLKPLLQFYDPDFDHDDPPLVITLTGHERLALLARKADHNI